MDVQIADVFSNAMDMRIFICIPTFPKLETRYWLEQLQSYIIWCNVCNFNLFQPILSSLVRYRWIDIFILFYKHHWTQIEFLSSLANLTHFIGQKFRGVLYILLNYTFSEQLLLQNIMFIMCRERRNLNRKKKCNFCKLAAKIHDLVRNKALPNFC